MNASEWEQERKRVDESDSLQSVKFLAKKAQDERDKLLKATEVFAEMAVEKKQNELFAAIKALEAISIKALEIAGTVVSKMPNDQANSAPGGLAARSPGSAATES